MILCSGYHKAKASLSEKNNNNNNKEQNFKHQMQLLNKKSKS